MEGGVWKQLIYSDTTWATCSPCSWTPRFCWCMDSKWQ